MVTGTIKGDYKMWQCPKCNRTFKNTNQSHYCGKVETIDDYIATQVDDVQPVLQELREIIHASAPNAKDKIAWNMPYFFRKENLVGFAAQKKHISFFPGEAAVSEFAERLAGYKFNKGTIQLPLDKPIDRMLIADIVCWVAEKEE
jgi:uncharacterized protein YdhG (YjbR/CyaY superfamily)